MINWPTPRYATKLVQSWSPDPSKFIGAEYLPDNVTDYTEAETIGWRVWGPILGKAPLIQLGADAPLAKKETVAEYTTKPAYIKLLDEIDEPDFIRLGKRDDPQQIQRAGLELFTARQYALWLKVQVQKEFLRWKAFNNALTAHTDDVTSVKLAVNYGLPAVTDVSIDWDEYATAKPVSDLRTELAAFTGSGVEWVDIVMSSKTAGYIFNNEYFVDLVRQSALVQELLSANLNGLFKSLCQNEGQAKIRSIRVYNEGYWSSNGTYTQFVPDNLVFLIGMRSTPMPGAISNMQEMLGEYANTPAMGEGGYSDIRPGDYALVEDNTRGKANRRFVLLACGNNGLPLIYHPSWVRRLNVKVT